MTESSTLREILGLLLDLRDEVVGKLLARDKIDSVDAVKIKKLLDDRLKDPELASRMGEVMSDFSEWSFRQGVGRIDSIIDGADLAGALNLPPESVDIAQKYIEGPSLIKTIPGQLLSQVHTQVALAFTGQRTPQEIADRIARRFDVSARRAETIMRTEGKRLSNIGAEQRIQTTIPQAADLGIPMVRFWIHSSGMASKAGAYDKATGTRKGFRPGKVRARYQPRPHHKAMHGVTVPIDKKFHLVNPITGEEWYIDGPHDEILPVGECANCYCDRSIRIDRKAMTAKTSEKQKAPETPPSPNPVGGFPASLDRLKRVKSLGGTTGAELVEDPDTGRRYVMKRGANAGHIREEASADAAYRAAGVNVPDFKLYETPKGPVKLAEYIPEAESLASVLRGGNQTRIAQVKASLQRDFAVDAVLGNWDAVGLDLDNVLVDRDGTPWRIDNGGSLRYRAQGAKKSAFAGDVSELASMRDPRQNGAAAKIFGDLPDAEVDRQIEGLLGRRDAILAALPPELHDVMRQRFADLESRLSPITEEFARSVVKSRIVGKVLRVDREDIEDTQVLYWAEQDASGNPVTKFKTRLTQAGSDKVMASLRDSLPSGSAPSDPYWDRVLRAAKTVNHHAHDGAYNQAAVSALDDVIRELVTLPDTPANRALQAYYGNSVSAIKTAMMNREQLAQLAQYVPPVIAPTGTLPVRRAQLEYRQKVTDRGFAKETPRAVHDGGECYEVELDGIRYRFVPYADANGSAPGTPYAFRGYLEAEITGEPTAERIRRMNAGLEKMGLVPDVAKDAFEEIVYLRKGMQIRTDVFDQRDLQHADDLIRGTATEDAEKIAALKQLVRDRMGIDPDKAKGYDPSPRGNSYGEGWERTYRWDLPREEVEKKLRSYTLHHSASGSVESVLDSILAGGGDFTPTTERLRKGVPISAGMSPTSDMETGGANYLFTRIHPKSSAARAVGFQFKIGNLARQDVFSYDHDRFGRVSDQEAYRARKKTVDEYKACAKRTGNETIFKNGINVLDEIEHITVASEAERRRVVDVFKKHGYTHLPDGREVESVVRVRS